MWELLKALPARQRRDIEDMATRHGFRILAWCEEHGLAERIEQRGRERELLPHPQGVLHNRLQGNSIVVSWN